MRELSIVVLAFAGLAGIGYGTQIVAQPEVYQLAWITMTVVTAVAIVAEVIYFAMLFAALRVAGDMPERWYARSFEHHHKLSGRQKRLVLPFFYLGLLGLSVSLVIAVLLVFASFGLFQSLPGR